MTERPILIDASERFNLRRQAAKLDFSQHDAVTVIKTILAEQPQSFLSHMQHEDPEIGAALHDVLADGMSAVIVDVGDEADDITAERMTDPGMGVVYTKGKAHRLEPKLYMSLGGLNLVGRMFGAFYNGIGNMQPTEKLEATVTAGAWMALGKWAVETIDPRVVQDPDTSMAALQAVSTFTGVEVHDLHMDDERVGNAMLVLSHRMAGAMAYRGLATYLKGRSYALAGELSLFQRMIEGLYDQRLQEANDYSHVTPLNFALAKPLQRADVETVFRCLGPVATELREQGRLVTREY